MNSRFADYTRAEPAIRLDGRANYAITPHRESPRSVVTVSEYQPPPSPPLRPFSRAESAEIFVAAARNDGIHFTFHGVPLYAPKKYHPTSPAPQRLLCPSAPFLSRLPARFVGRFFFLGSFAHRPANNIRTLRLCLPTFLPLFSSRRPPLSASTADSRSAVVCARARARAHAHAHGPRLKPTTASPTDLARSRNNSAR